MSDDLPQPLVVTAPVEVPPAPPVLPITYADKRTDRERKDELFPDLVEARIAANAIGGGFLLAGFLFVLFLRGDSSWVLMSLVAASYVLPGVVLLRAGRMIARRRRVGVIVATAGGCWVMLAMATLAIAELVALLSATRTIGSPWFRVLIHLLFLGLAAKLAFHAFRATLFTGQTESADVATWLTPEGVMPRLAQVTRAMLLGSFGSHLLLLAATGGCWYLSTALITPLPPPPPFITYAGNVNLPPPAGLGAWERSMVIRYLRTQKLSEDQLLGVDTAVRDHAYLLFSPTRPTINRELDLSQILRIESSIRFQPTPTPEPAAPRLDFVDFQQSRIWFGKARATDFSIGGLHHEDGRWRSTPAARWWSVAAADRAMQVANAKLGGRIREQQGVAMVFKAAASPWSPGVVIQNDSLPAPFVNLRMDPESNVRAQTATGEWLVTPDGQALDASVDDGERAHRIGRWATKLAVDPRAPQPLLWCAVAGICLALWPLLDGRALRHAPVAWACLRLGLLGVTALAALWLLSSILVIALDSQRYAPAVATMTLSAIFAALFVAEGIWFPLILLQSVGTRRCRGEDFAWRGRFSEISIPANDKSDRA